MKYKTYGELAHFDFSESYIADIWSTGSSFWMTLDNVTIEPENSCNRDIRRMRTNGLVLCIEEGSIKALVEEGYKVYDANGRLLQQLEDRTLAAEEYNEILKACLEGAVYALEKREDGYCFTIDANDHTYLLTVAGARDTEEWDRFLNKE